MYKLSALLIGALFSATIAINGVLARQYGSYIAAIFSQGVGLCLAFVAMRLRKEHFLPAKRLPLWVYTGGLFGVSTTLLNNFAFGHISMTAIVALSLFGKAVTSLVIDCFGLFGMAKRRFSAAAAAGFIFSVCGVAVMLHGSESAAATATALALGSGVAIVISRTINAEYGKHTSPIGSAFFNYIMALTGAVVTALVAAWAGKGLPSDPVTAPWWAYMGGVVSVSFVLLSNITVPRLPSLQATLLVFVGQVFTGIFIDLCTKEGFSPKTFWGGVLVAAGVAANMAIDSVKRRSGPGKA